MKSAVDAAISRKTVRFELSKVNLIYASKKKRIVEGGKPYSKTLMSATTNYTATLDTLFPEQNNSEGGVGEEAREGRVVSEFY